MHVITVQGLHEALAGAAVAEGRSYQGVVRPPVSHAQAAKVCGSLSLPSRSSRYAFCVMLQLMPLFLFVVVFAVVVVVAAAAAKSTHLAVASRPTIKLTRRPKCQTAFFYTRQPFSLFCVCSAHAPGFNWTELKLEHKAEKNFLPPEKRSLSLSLCPRGDFCCYCRSGLGEILSSSLFSSSSS